MGCGRDSDHTPFPYDTIVTMTFISKIPKSALVALLAMVGFTSTFFIVDSMYIRPPFSKLLVLLILFLNFLPGIVSAGITWFAMRKTHKNAWAVAIVTGFAMLGVMEILRGLIGPIFGYMAMLPITWGLLVVNSRIFSASRHTVLKFCILFILCAALWQAGHLFLTWMFYMRAATLY